MKKLFKRQNLGVLLIIGLAIFVASCNRGTGCPGSFGLILPLF